MKLVKCNQVKELSSDEETLDCLKMVKKITIKS